MAHSLATNFKASIDWLFKDALDLSTVAESARLEYSAPLANGVAADQADQIWPALRPALAAGANDDLDLTALTRALLGGSVTASFARVKAILLIHPSTAAGEKLRIDTSLASGFTGPTGGAAGKVEVGADSALLLMSKKDGWPVDSTHKMLRVTNAGAASVAYQIVIVGTSS